MKIEFHCAWPVFEWSMPFDAYNQFPKLFLHWMKIFYWNFIYCFVLDRYRSSLSFVMLDLFLTSIYLLMNCLNHFFWTFHCTGWRCSTEIWFMICSWVASDYVWVLLPLIYFWLHYVPWWVTRINFPDFSPNLWSYLTEIWYMALLGYL
jgi:hypothetical protein